jgi:hypothetical protein
MPLKANSKSTSTMPAPINKSLPFFFKMDFGLSFGGTKGEFPFALGGGLPAAICCGFPRALVCCQIHSDQSLSLCASLAARRKRNGQQDGTIHLFCLCYLELQFFS